METKEIKGQPLKTGQLVLHRKWRSRDFNDLVGQEHVKRTLKNALSLGRIAPAYLFSGPRGTGKTSTARILAKAINCPTPKEGQPCSQCRICNSITEGSCMDVIEMDAASHTQVDKIREFIVEKVHFRPVETKKKIYIIDEVHKLSSFSFDALLKTIEEPPPFVIFILATTEPDKLPPTIISRCQRFDFKRIPVGLIVERLRMICDKEGFCVEESALNLIAQSSEGALRDALVIMEQAVSFSQGDCITGEEIISLLGMTRTEVLFYFADLIFNKDTPGTLNFIDQAYREGKDLHRLSVDLLEHFRKLLLILMTGDARAILEITDDYYKRLEEQAQFFKTFQLLYIIKELMELRQNLKNIGMERILWETVAIKMTRWETAPSLDGINRRLEMLEKKIEGIRAGTIIADETPAETERTRVVPLRRKEAVTDPSSMSVAGAPSSPSPSTRTELKKSTTPVSLLSPHHDAGLLDLGSVSPPAQPSKSHVRVDIEEKKTPVKEKPSHNDASLWNQLVRKIQTDCFKVFPLFKQMTAGKLIRDEYHLKFAPNQSFFKTKINQNKKKIEDILGEITGGRIKLILEETNTPGELFPASPPEKQKSHEELVQEVQDLFGATPVNGGK